MPLPATDFDPTETAIPWRVLSDAGFDVVFATPDGQPAQADDRMVSGRGLGIWRPVLRAAKAGRDAYAAMIESPAFKAPIAYDALDISAYRGLVLPGGHAPGMRPYLESEQVQSCVADMMAADKPVAAICHGVIALARSRQGDGRSVVEGRRLTALTKSMEMSAFQMTRLWLGNYYRTYPATVQAEVTAALGGSGVFETGPFALRRDTPEHLERGFVVRDRNLVTARWPGDAHRFAHAFVEMLRE